MEIKKLLLMFSLLFFLEGFVFAQGEAEDSGDISAASAIPAAPAVPSASAVLAAETIPDTNVPVNASLTDNESPVSLSESGTDLLFYRRLTWDEARYAVRYTVVMEQKRDNLDAYMEVLRRNTEQTFIDITVPPGEYRFLVMSFNVLGLLDAQSEWDYFIVRNPITLQLPRNGVSLSNNPLSPSPVIWSTELSLQNSRVIFSREPEPARDPRAIVQYVDQGITTINLPPLGEGIWYWTVLGDTADGLSVSAAAPMWFTLVSLPLLSSPQYTKPDYNEIITLDQLMEERKISFEWEPVPEANAYIFSLYGITEKQDLLYSSSPSAETSFDLTDLTILKMDDYVWQVEAVLVSRNGTIERRGIIQQQSFVVYIRRSDTLRTRNPATIYGF